MLQHPDAGGAHRHQAFACGFGGVEACRGRLGQLEIFRQHPVPGIVLNAHRQKRPRPHVQGEADDLDPRASRSCNTAPVKWSPAVGQATAPAGAAKTV